MARHGAERATRIRLSKSTFNTIAPHLIDFILRIGHTVERRIESFPDCAFSRSVLSCDHSNTINFNICLSNFTDVFHIDFQCMSPALNLIDTASRLSHREFSFYGTPQMRHTQECTNDTIRKANEGRALLKPTAT